MAAKTLAILVATYNQGDYVLRTLIYSLLSQTSGDFRCYVVHDGPSIDSTKQFMEEICDQYPDLFDYIETNTRTEKWGHPGRQLALDLCTEPFVTFTNADNLVVKDYVKLITKFIHEQPSDVFITPIIHNYFNYHVFPGDRFGLCLTDFANVIFKTDLVKQVPLRINEFAADGHLFEDFKKKFPKFKLTNLPHILAVHQ